MKKTKRLLSSVLVGAMLLASAVPTFAAEESVITIGAETGDTENSGGGSGVVSLVDSLTSVAYDEYLKRYKDIPMAGSKDTVEIKGVDYKADATTAGVEVKSGVYGKKDDVLFADVNGTVTWEFNVKKAAMYNVNIEYAAVEKEGRDGSVTSGANNIERVFYINGSVPFAETRTLSLKKTWSFKYTENEDGDIRFEKDSGGSELRPKADFIGQWENTTLFDSSTYYTDDLTYYFNEGTNTISLQGIREDMYISKITLTAPEELPTYEEYRADHEKKGHTAPEGVEPVHFHAETPDYVSSSTITPSYDRSSAITEPQHPTAIMRNTIGGSSWANTSDWIRYEVEIPESGMYTIVFRYKQDSVPGSFVSRALKVNGEYPFAEARYCSFEYGQEWQVDELHSGETKFEIYLEKGTQTVEFMVTVGSFGDILTKVEDVADEMNEAYLQIVRLTGAYPDENRDYNFGRVMPEAVRAIQKSAVDIETLLKYIKDLSGGAAYNVASLESAQKILKEMSADEHNIAKNLTLMKSSISDMSKWCSDLESQPLMIDYMVIQPAGAKLPEAEAGVIASLKYEIGQFIGSFYTNYNSFSDEEEGGDNGEPAESIECWMSSGRDRATIIRDLVNSGFCDKEGINVSLKLVDAGALLPSVLAGIGPDLSLDGVSTIDYAIRGAVLPLNDYEGFDEVCERFHESTLTPNSLYGKTYALPTTVDFSMMFVRNDILARLGLEAPETWEDFLALIPVLQYNNMTVIVPNDYKMFLYQMGGDIWDQTSEDMAEWGWRVTYNDDTTLTAFSKMCNLFTEHSLLPSADFQTRFKTGVAPVAITSYSAYTTLTVFAPEIAGLWEMRPIPGTVQADGSVNNTTVATAGGLAMLKGDGNKDATWKFMCWYTDVDFQVDLCNELITLLGPAAKTTTANKAAMAEMPWSATEYRNLMAQYENTVGIPAYPGSYVVDRYTGMAFNAAYSDGENPAEALLQYVNSANNEISRKRAEFGMPLYEDRDADDAEK